MIIHVLIPHFWIVVEERRRPDLRDRAVIIGNSFLEKTAGHAWVLMANDLAESCGVRPGITLAHARQLCPEAVILSPELPVYAGVWDEVMALLLTYTPLVESLDPGEGVCDVTGCERLFGNPVSLAWEITRLIDRSLGLPAVAGVGTNRLVAQLAVKSLEATSRRFGDQESDGGIGAQVCAVRPGEEAAFLAPFPITALPEIDPDTLIAFQVLGLKTVEHVTRISEAAFGRRFGPLGRRLAKYARGWDDRAARPAPHSPAVSVSRRCDCDLVDGLEPDQVLVTLAERLASNLADALRTRNLAGRLVTLILRTSRERIGVESAGSGPILPHVVKASAAQAPPAGPREQFFPNQDSRIHSMLPQPPQPGRDRVPVPVVVKRSKKTAVEAHRGRDEPEPELWNQDPGSVVLTMARMAAGRSTNDRRMLTELSQRLLLRMLTSMTAEEMVSAPGAELQLEIRHFAPPEQMAIPGLDGRPLDVRLDRLHRQENILASRFGATPFRHLAAVDLDSVLSERIFRWGDGMNT